MCVCILPPINGVNSLQNNVVPYFSVFFSSALRDEDLQIYGVLKTYSNISFEHCALIKEKNGTCILWWRIHIIGWKQYRKKYRKCFFPIAVLLFTYPPQSASLQPVRITVTFVCISCYSTRELFSFFKRSLSIK